MRYRSRLASCNCGDPAAGAAGAARRRHGPVHAPNTRSCGDSSARVHTHTHTHPHTRANAYTYTRQRRITRGRDFFITVRADCIFLRLSTTGVSNLENRVEGGPSNHVFLAIVFRVDPGCPALLDPPSPPARVSSSLDTILF